MGRILLDKAVRVQTRYVLSYIVIGSEIFTASLCLVLGYLWWGRISYDLLCIGAIISFIVSAIMGGTGIALVKYAADKSTSELILKKELEARRAEAETVRKSEAALVQAQRIAHIGNWEWDTQTDELLWSDELRRIFGYEEVPLKAVPDQWWQSIHADDFDRVRRWFVDLVKGSGQGDIEFRIQRRDGGQRTLFARSLAIRNPDGTTIRLQGTAQDVTAIREMEQQKALLEVQLRQSQRLDAIGQLAGGVAHDFNNMLTIILGQSEILLEDFADDSETRAALTAISTAGDKAAALTRQLLAFSRKQVLQPTVLELNDLIDDLGKMLRRLIGEDVRLAWIPTGPC
jgi:PAS domain S-box-containing protein